MGRWRPPQPKSSAYITQAGFETLHAELEQIWVRRRDVTKHLAAAAAEGDRSENAEYIYRKKELREIDRRIRYLQKRLPDLTVVEQRQDDCQQIFFGAWVTLEKDAGEEVIYRIVGPDELDPKKGWISIDSPLARALLKKTVDDEVLITTEKAETEYYVINVRYQPETDSGE